MSLFNEFGKDKLCTLLEMSIFKISRTRRTTSFWREGGFPAVSCKRANMEGSFLRAAGIVSKNTLSLRYSCCDKLYPYSVNRFTMSHCRRSTAISKGSHSLSSCLLCLIIALAATLALWRNNNCVVWRSLFPMAACRGVIPDMTERKQ